jgi:hypothetical protein
MADFVSVSDAMNQNRLPQETRSAEFSAIEVTFRDANELMTALRLSLSFMTYSQFLAWRRLWLSRPQAASAPHRQSLAERDRVFQGKN